MALYIILAGNVYVHPSVCPSFRPSQNTAFANIPGTGPVRELNLGTQIDWTLSNAMPRPEASACAEHGA